MAHTREYMRAYYLNNKDRCDKNNEKYRSTPKGKVRRRHNMLKWSYGISIEAYNLLRCLQRFTCSICGRHESQLPRKLDVDHNHETGEVRGLLCNDCNVGMGRIKETNLEAARAYLASY